jgi:hypothetical protein
VILLALRDPAALSAVSLAFPRSRLLFPLSRLLFRDPA